MRLLLLAFAALLSYWPIWTVHQRVDPDAHIILPALKLLSLSEYLRLLFSFETVDVQPFRDLSFKIDLMFFDTFNINTFVFHNILFWIAGCFISLKVLEQLFPKISRNTLYLFILGFCLYPLFSVTISWGMARKHLMTFFLIMLATHLFLDKKRALSFVVLCYFISVFSQPIAILWPLWLFAFCYLLNPDLLPRFKRVAPALFAILISGLTINYFYYSQSGVFASIYDSKTSETFNFADKILAFGHYMYTLFFPYNTAYFYYLGHWSIWVGIILTGLFTYLYLGLKLPRRTLLVWSLFAILPLAMILSNPNWLSDVYLLLPGFALLVLLVTFYERFRPRMLKWIALPLIIFWGFWSGYSSSFWTDLVKFSRDYNWERNPNCNSAIRNVRVSYVYGVQVSNEAKNYIHENQCYQSNTYYKFMDNLILQTHLVYHENYHSFEGKVELLRKMGTVHFYPNLVLVALYLKNGRELEAKDTIEKIMISSRARPFEPQYDSIIGKVVYPFCEKIKNEECSKALKPFSIKENLPYYP